jgi:indolepyruvate ferredoxin oxidoreductase beta subunit
MIGYLGEGGVLVYYDAVWQPLDVRLKKSLPVDESRIKQACEKRHIRFYPVFHEDLPDSRMQNVALLASIDRHQLIPEVKTDHYLRAMDDLMAGSMLEMNLKLFKKITETE